MPVKISQMPYEPIILCEYIGAVKADDLQRVRWQTSMYAGAINGPVYRVSDARYVDLAELLSRLADEESIIAELIVVPREMLKAAELRDYQVFGSIHEALAFARRHQLRAVGD